MVECLTLNQRVLGSNSSGVLGCHQEQDTLTPHSTCLKNNPIHIRHSADSECEIPLWKDLGVCLLEHVC